MQAYLKDLELELWLRYRDLGKIVWTTKDGVQIPINEMTTSHLVNSINMLKRLEEAFEELACEYESENFGDR